MTARKPLWAKCRECGTCWEAAHYPCDTALFSRRLSRARCPQCNANKPLLAKQNNGVLNEPVTPLTKKKGKANG